jgi:hypothetical protein
MNAKRRSFQAVIVASFIYFAMVVGASAQDTSTTTTSSQQPSKDVQIRNGVVVYVSGNDLVVKTDDGQVKHLTVPEGATAEVDGKQVSVHNLKPGMKLQQTITTTTTPMTVKTVRTIKGQVVNVQPPVSVVLKLADGSNKLYKIPEGQKFDIEGTQTDAFALKKGMHVTATVITDEPTTEVAEQKQVTGETPLPPPTPPQKGALLIE